MGLTKEEKKALKIAKKLAKAAATAAAAKQRKIDELEREMTAHEMQRVELETRLRELMNKAKEPVFKQNIEVMLHTFDRSVDKKNHLISLIMELRNVANNQYQRTICSFCEVVDGIIGTFLGDLEAMCLEGDRKTRALLQQGKEEKEYIIEYQKNGETHLNILLYHAHELADNLAWTIRGENFVKLDEDTNKYLEIRDVLRSILEGLYNYTWEQYKGTLKSYIVGTSENQKQVRVLRKKEAMMSDIIASQARKIAASEGIIRRLRIELAAYESGTKQASFRDRRQRHKEACLRLKKNFITGVDTDNKQLQTLVIASTDSVKYLENACEKSEKILRMAALCRRLETQYEKVLPFGSVMPNDEENMDKNDKHTHVRRKQTEDCLVVNAVATTCGLTRLWQRISKVELSKRALLREKMLLERENAELMRILEMGNNEKLIAKAEQCACFPKTSKKSIHLPNAVEGSLEAKKILHYY